MEWLVDILMNNLIGIITALSAVIALIAERRKRNAERKTSEAEALSSMQSVYDKFTADTEKRIRALLDEVQHLRTAVKTLEDDLDAANEKLKEFEKQAELDKKEIIALRKKIERYERELKTYQKSQE